MKKILIIEDDTFLQGLEVNKLTKNNFEVVTASTGEDGMEKIKDPTISLVLLDLVLPNFDGFQILEKIRETKNVQQLPVIVFSNLSEDAEIEKGRKLGVNEFMVKSNFSLDELIEKINTILK